MSHEALDLWQRALRTLASARLLVASDPDSAASRAYYAAFHAVSALFALGGTTFNKHSAVHSAVHRDLVKKGRWDRSLGEDYSSLLVLRQVGDYGGHAHVDVPDAKRSLEAASRIVEAVRAAHVNELGES